MQHIKAFKGSLWLRREDWRKVRAIMGRPAGRPYWYSRQKKTTVAQIRVLVMEMERSGYIPDILRGQDLNVEVREGQNQMGGGVMDWVANSRRQGLGVQITHWAEKCGVQGAFETCKKDVSRAVGYTALELRDT